MKLTQFTPYKSRSKSRNAFKLLPYFALFILLSTLLLSCQKMDRPAMNIIEDDLERMNGPLQAYLPFNGNLTDSAQYQKVSNSGTMTYTEGINQEAFQGNGDAVVQLPLTDKLVDLSSFTVAFWLNADKSSMNAQTVFVIGNSGDFWGNIFALIESNTNDEDPTMLLKLNFAGNWVEFNGNPGMERLPDMYGNWKHVVFQYDEETSEVAVYIDGNKINLPEDIAQRTKDDAPLGPIKLDNASKLIIGGFQQHAGVSGDPDDWMDKFSGKLDQFRLYTTALTAAEIKKLYTEKM